MTPSLGPEHDMGAKLGAIRCGPVWTAVDTCGIESLSFRAVWTAVDCCGLRVEIYGSEGWGFQSLRACRLLAGQLDDLWTAVGPHLVRESFTTRPVECHRKSLHIGREEVPVAVHRHRNR